MSVMKTPQVSVMSVMKTPQVSVMSVMKTPQASTFVALQRGDGGVRLLLQLQQRDLTRVVADEGVLRLVVVSERGVRAGTHSSCTGGGGIGYRSKGPQQVHCREDPNRPKQTQNQTQRYEQTQK